MALQLSFRQSFQEYMELKLIFPIGLKFQLGFVHIDQQFEELFQYDLYF